MSACMAMDSAFGADGWWTACTSSHGEHVGASCEGVHFPTHNERIEQGVLKPKEHGAHSEMSAVDGYPITYVVWQTDSRGDSELRVVLRDEPGFPLRA